MNTRPIERQLIKEEAEARKIPPPLFRVDHGPPVMPDQMVIGLKYKYALFVEEYVKDLNPIRAALAAGFTKSPAKSARLLLRNPKVLDRIAFLKKEQAERMRLTPDFILGRLVALTLRAEQDDDRATLLRSLEMLGKNQSLWIDRVDNTHRFENAFTTGNTEEDIEADTKRLLHVASSLLRPASAGQEEKKEEKKKEKEEEDVTKTP